MPDNQNEIIELAQKLSIMINNHEISRKYRDSCETLKNDYKAQEIFQKLIMLGRDINDQLSRSDKISYDSQSEIEFFQNELENNRFVKEHILIQKEYLNMIKLVLDRIKNPLEH